MVNEKGIKVKNNWEQLKLAADNLVEMDVDSLPQNEGFARVAVASFLTQLNPTLEEVDDVKTAVSEAVTNCVIHGYDLKGKSEELEEKNKNVIRIEMFLFQNRIYIKIEDYGLGIDDIEKAMEPLYTSKPDMERSGMGFAFMEAFMDELFVESEPMIGTKVYMAKQIGGK